MANVELAGLQKAFGDVQVLRDIDLKARDGEFMVFVGPSGCGKSTLLRTIAGLEDITSGTLKIGGRVVNDIPPAERGIATVFQSYALYPHMDLFENMAFGPKLAKMPKAEVFSFDEPLSNLDAALRVKMRYEFAKLHEELKTTMIYVTHGQVEAMTLADRIVVPSAGRIEQVGSPLELYEHPRNLFVAGFIGSPKMNFLEGTVKTASKDEATVALAGGGSVRCLVDASQAKTGDKVTFGVRPEHFEVGGGENALPTKVVFVETLGSATVAYCYYTGLSEPLTCELDGRVRPKNGQAVTLSVPASRTYMFGADGMAMRRLAPGQVEQRAA